MSGIWRSVCRVWLETYHGAFVMILKVAESSWQHFSLKGKTPDRWNRHFLWINSGTQFDSILFEWQLQNRVQGHISYVLCFPLHHLLLASSGTRSEAYCTALLKCVFGWVRALARPPAHIETTTNISWKWVQISTKDTHPPLAYFLIPCHYVTISAITAALNSEGIFRVDHENLTIIEF
jgi:hypothetical protein